MNPIQSCLLSKSSPKRSANFCNRHRVVLPIAVDLGDFHAEVAIFLLAFRKAFVDRQRLFVIAFPGKHIGQQSPCAARSLSVPGGCSDR